MSTDDKDDFKVYADARLKLEKDTALALPCMERDDSRAEPQALATSIDASEEQSDSENTRCMRESEATTDGPTTSPKIRYVGSVSLRPGTQASFNSQKQ